MQTSSLATPVLPPGPSSHPLHRHRRLAKGVSQPDLHDPAPLARDKRRLIKRRRPADHPPIPKPEPRPMPRTRHHLSFDLALDRKSTRLNSSHVEISYAVFCLKKKT